jgi:hypothetical protein
MSRKSQPEINKIKADVLNNIQRLGITVQQCPHLGKSIYSLNNKTTIDLIYSSLSTRNEYFFGIEEEQFYNVYQLNRNFFQLFICENNDQVFVVPLSFMIEMLKSAKANDHITYHQWKPIIRNRNGVFILRCYGIYEITDYLNRYDYLIQEDDSNKQQMLFNEPIKFKTEIEVKSEYQKLKDLVSDYKLNKNDLHSTTIFMLKKMGEWLGYKVLTETVPPDIPNFPYRIDCLWYKDDDLYLAIEVCDKGNIEKDKDALKQAKNFGARKVVIVTEIKKLERIRKLFMYNGELKYWTEVWTFNRVFNMFENGQKFFRDFTKFRSYQWNENIVEYV